MAGSVSREDYEPLRRWFAEAADLIFPSPPAHPSETAPLAALDAIAERSPANARRGLAMAIGDIMEIASDLPASEIARIDAHLAERNLPTLSRMRWRFLGRVRRIIERGTVRSETEYHALRNVVDDVDDEAQRRIIWAILAAYEEKAAAARD